MDNMEPVTVMRERVNVQLKRQLPGLVRMTLSKEQGKAREAGTAPEVSDVNNEPRRSRPTHEENDSAGISSPPIEPKLPYQQLRSEDEENDLRDASDNTPVDN